MTDQTKDIQPTSEAPVVVATAVVSDEAGVQAEAAIAVQGDRALIVARFADMDSARATYEGLREAEARRAIDIDGVLVASADYQGKIHVEKMTDHHTRKGLKWGAVAGVALGIIFPPSIIASAVAVGVAGAAVGKIGNVLAKGRVADELAGVITPGSSGIIALVDIVAVDAVKQEMPKAEEIKSVPVDAETADAIKEAAAAAGDSTGG